MHQTNKTTGKAIVIGRGVRRMNGRRIVGFHHRSLIAFLVLGVSSTSSETFDEELGRFERCFRTNQFTRVSALPKLPRHLNRSSKLSHNQVSAHLDWIKSIVGNRPEQDYCSSMLVKKH